MIKVPLVRWVQNNFVYSTSQHIIFKFPKCTIANLNNIVNKADKNTTNWKDALYRTMKVYPNFITEEEEISLMKEIDPYMQRLRYEFSHWDDAIHGYRETERKQWNEQNMKVINRIRQKAFPPGMPQLNLVHILDLTAEGWIKPHIDSVRFCGDVIAGLSLLSDSVMRLTMVSHEQEYREDFLLPRKSLYIMNGVARQKYNHEILKSEESYFQGQKIPRSRRISIICRSEIYQINRQWYKLLEMCIIIIISVHWAACLEYYIPLIVSNVFGRNRGSWIDSDALKERGTNFHKYLICLNRATIALVCSAHYLDMKTPDDILINIILSVMGILGFIFALTQIMQFMNTLQSATKTHYKHFQQLQEYIKYKQLPYNLQRRILEYFNYCSKKKFTTYQHIIHQVSAYLQEELILNTYMKFINNVPLFQYIPESVVSQLINVLNFKIYLENDIIVKAGEEGDGLYFIASGTVAIYNNLWKEVCHLEDGTYFGDVFLFLKSMHHNVNIVAVEICEIYILQRTNFQLIMESHLDLFNVLYNAVSKHVKKT
ncbi:hypothetical protein HZH68_008602 [Vespula germanica]|uniref:Cyclic nucleotide-binding domain-containing protein n=1 Tax=Vespula germanica TaxID=30212 RepID=A0A834N5D4_VESGE|nr:hypothetical protein HZH68_008602 [Vespula germanica]